MRVLDSMRYSGGDVEFLSYALTCTSRLHYMYSSLTILSTLFLYYFSFLFHHFCFFFFFLIFLSSFISTIFPYPIFFFFFLNDPAPTEIYPLPLHAALPISHRTPEGRSGKLAEHPVDPAPQRRRPPPHEVEEDLLLQAVQVPGPPACLLARQALGSEEIGRAHV